jgi:hypothetical protein
MRVLPRFPARITATNGLEVVQDNLDLVLRPDFGSLIQVPSVSNPTTTFFWGWDQSLDSYSSISFQNLVDNIQDVIIGENLAGIADLTVSADQVPYYLDGDGTASTYTVSSYVRSVSDAADEAAFLTAIGAAPDTAIQPTDTSTADFDFVVDEDDMSSDSATKVPTQQSVKAYVDALTVDDDRLAAPSRIRNKLDFWTVYDFFSSYSEAQAVRAGTATGDHVTYLQAAADSQEVVQFPPRIFNVGSELVIKNGTKFFGAGAMWKRRTGYTQAQAPTTTIKWIGADAANTAVVRVSRTAVGTQGSVFTPPNGDDLVGFILRDIHVNADNKARYGWYMYRCGNNGNVGNLTAEKARLRCFLMNGIFAADWGHFGAYECESHGVSVGEDTFSWGTESNCFEFKASFHLCNNGTNGTFVLGTGTDLVESGGIFSVGRGSSVKICSESNFGRACIIKPNIQANSTDGPAFYEFTYLEGNGAGPYYYSYPGARGHVMRQGFIHPGNAASPGVDRFSGTLKPQDIYIRAYTNAGVLTSNEGPTDRSQWPVIEKCYGENQGVGFGIDSNTTKYHVRDVPTGVVYVGSRPDTPGVFARAFFKADATLSDTRLVVGAALTRLAAGRYRLTFDAAQVDANYSVTVNRFGSGSITHFLQVGPSKSTTVVEIEQFAAGALGTPVDTATGFVEIVCTRLEDGR